MIADQCRGNDHKIGAIALLTVFGNALIGQNRNPYKKKHILSNVPIVFREIQFLLFTCTCIFFTLNLLF